MKRVVILGDWDTKIVWPDGVEQYRGESGDVRTVAPSAHVGNGWRLKRHRAATDQHGEILVHELVDVPFASTSS